MRHAILLDTKISNNSYEEWVGDDTAFWKKYIGITPEYTLIRQDYSTYPIFVDGAGNIRPTDAYLKSLNDQVVAKYGEFAFDFVMVMVHEDNWLSDPLGDKGKGIWGTNYSYIFGKQCLDYCRWDRDNSANTFGTAYHERHHSFDAMIKQETGIVIEPSLSVGIGKYDNCITHGNCDPWKYIRFQENTKSLEIMAPHLRKAFSLREQKHRDNDKRKELIGVLQDLVYLLRMQLNSKYGVTKG